MNQFEFKLHGGITVQFEEDKMIIEVKGVKGLFFQRIKPRTVVIPFKDIKKIDYKGAGITIGYIRFITPEIEEFPSSMYVAESCPYSVIFEKDEMETFNKFLKHIQKILPNIEKVRKKV